MHIVKTPPYVPVDIIKNRKERVQATPILEYCFTLNRFKKYHKILKNNQDTAILINIPSSTSNLYPYPSNPAKASLAAASFNTITSLK